LGELGASRSRFPIQLRLLDEPFDGLDGLGAEQVVQVLQSQVVPNAGTVLVMTHDDNLKSLIGDRLQVVKENGVSWVLE
jgi:ABC-type transporter Mla maintaining outer membrane lipid asymmetry ATPase subunit MlaF